MVNLTGEPAPKRLPAVVRCLWKMNGGSSRPLALTTGVRMDDHTKPTVNTGVRVPTVYNATDTVTVKGLGDGI